MGPPGEDDLAGLRLDPEAFRRDGALKLPRLFDEPRLARLRELPVEGPGVRLQSPDLPLLIAPATEAASALLGAPARPVRALLFDKTAAANWAVGWHQDRTVAVRERRDAPGFGPWSRKGGALHVSPPIEVLQDMATLRIHVDAVGPDNAPLKAAIGSHRLGRVPEADIAMAVADLPQLVCLAHAGDVWAYATLILHASERAAKPGRRRVLQVDYATRDLPHGLEWAGIG